MTTLHQHLLGADSGQHFSVLIGDLDLTRTERTAMQ